ncbi:MAG: hypothetical protein ACJAR2_003020 [Ilumatobacter sp.]
MTISISYEPVTSSSAVGVTVKVVDSPSIVQVIERSPVPLLGLSRSLAVARCSLLQAASQTAAMRTARSGDNDR